MINIQFIFPRLGYCVIVKGMLPALLRNKEVKLHADSAIDRNTKIQVMIFK